MATHDFDVAVVGGGSGGYAAARTAAAAGLRAVVIEGAPQLGGLCILRGCMPTKALLHTAEVKYLASHPEIWGIRTKGVEMDFLAVKKRVDGLIAEFADYRGQQLTNGPFKLIRGQARFADPHTLALDNGQTLTASHFVISTGSVVAPSQLPSLTEVGFLTSDDALALTQLPKSMIILGGGAVAVEFAQMFARFDVKVTVIQRGSRFLKEFDPDATSALEKVFRDEGITLFTGTQLLGASRGPQGKRVSFMHDGKQTQVEAGEILFALGRVPNTANLGLDKAGVKTDDGGIVVNDMMQTSAQHIYAAGDCIGRHDIVHIAVQQGEIAANNIARPNSPRRFDDRLLISVVFTDPHAAFVGLTENEARARNIPYIAASYPFADHGKSMIMEARDGFVKLLANPATGEIIGGCCVGSSGGELIHEIVVAMAKRVTVAELAAVPHYHPTLAEIWTYPAEELMEKIAK